MEYHPLPLLPADASEPEPRALYPSPPSPMRPSSHCQSFPQERLGNPQWQQPREGSKAIPMLAPERNAKLADVRRGLSLPKSTLSVSGSRPPTANSLACPDRMDTERRLTRHDRLGKRADSRFPMITLFRLAVMAIAALVEQAFLADPTYISKPRHLVRFRRPRQDAEHRIHCPQPEPVEAIAGFKT